MSIKLSVLDQTPIRRGSTATEALQESIELARYADSLGYTRYWVSEHHNFSTLAGAAPEVLIARLASEASNMRFGSGGIMLPNHSTLKVAENFRLLEALYPGRIDLGIGRAPGGDRLTASLLNPSNKFDPQEYIQQIADLYAFLGDDGTVGTVHEKVKAIPQIPTAPEMWMLTSSGESAYIAAHFGMAVSFAQFINPIGGPQALQSYRERFKPSEYLYEPQTSVGIFAFCGDTREKADRMQSVMDYRMLSLERGRPDLAPDWDTVRNSTYTSDEKARIRFNRQRMIIGTRDEVRDQLIALAATFDTREIILSTFSETAEDRLRSYELIAQEMKISTPLAVAPK